MQDWLYLRGGTLEFTLELSPNKWPKSDELHAVCEAAKLAMIRYPLQALFGGVWGRVRAGGLPVRISVPSGGASFSAAPGFGTFFRALAPGTHTLVFSAEGRQAVERTVDVPVNGSGVELNVVLGVDPDAAVPSLPFPFPILAGRTFRDKVTGELRGIPGHVDLKSSGFGKDGNTGVDSAPVANILGHGNNIASSRLPMPDVNPLDKGQNNGEYHSHVATEHGSTLHTSGPRSFWAAGRWLLFAGGTGWLIWQIWISGIGAMWCGRRHAAIRHPAPKRRESSG
jgi:hypothetical protein